MSEEQLKELQNYNLEYLEARSSEEIFGGDYTSEVELKYAKKEIERLNNDIKELLKENENKEKVIKVQDNIIKEVREKIKEFCWDYEYETYSNMTSDEIKELAELLDKEVN